MNINELASLHEKLCQSLKEGVYNFDRDGFHMNEKVFLQKFDTYKTMKRDTVKYPYKLSTNVNGVRFYCLITQEQYEEITPVDDAIAELESRLAELKSKKEMAI